MATISLSKRKDVIRMHGEGANQVLIAKTLVISRVTLQNFSSRNTALDKPRSGRPPKLSQRDKRKIVIESKRNPFDTIVLYTRVVRSKCGFSNTMPLHNQECSQARWKMGRIAVRVYKNKQLQFCQTKLNFTSVDWSK